jgi:hypothetical protein
MTGQELEAAPHATKRPFQFSLRTLMLFVAGVAVVCSVCASIAFIVDRARWIREPDPNPVWTIDAAKPWTLELRRGSGWHGYDTIDIDQTGGVVLHRLPRTVNSPLREKATMQIPPRAVAEVLARVSEYGIMSMYRAYHARGVFDGTQWDVTIKQGDREKKASFDNYFPDEIVRFADSLDAILDENGLGDASWQPVPFGQ